MTGYCNLTLEETLQTLNVESTSAKRMSEVCKKLAKEILPTTTGEPDWRYMRVDVRERESGCPEWVISVPFKIEGL